MVTATQKSCPRSTLLRSSPQPSMSVPTWSESRGGIGEDDDGHIALSSGPHGCYHSVPTRWFRQECMRSRRQLTQDRATESAGCWLSGCRPASQGPRLLLASFASLHHTTPARARSSMSSQYPHLDLRQTPAPRVCCCPVACRCQQIASHSHCGRSDMRDSQLCGVLAPSETVPST
jgi:hypothetical protein